MSRPFLTAFGLALVCLPALTHSVQGKPSLSRASQYVTRAESNITRAEGMLDKAMAAHGQILDSTLVSVKNQVEDAKEHLGKADAMLKELSDPGKEAVEQAASQARQRLKKVEERMASAGQVIEQADANLAQGAAKDSDTLEALKETLGKLSADTRGSKPDLRRVDLWPQIKKDAEALISKYASTKGSRGGGGGGVEQREFANSVQGLKTEFQYFLTELKNINKKQKSVMQELGELLKVNLENAQANKEASAPRISAADLMETLTRRCHVLKVMGADQPEFDQGFIDQTLAKVKEGRAILVKIENEIIAGNSLPTEGYGGIDKESLRAALRERFLSVHPNAKILKIILEDTQFSRMVSWQWSSSLAWYKEDISTLDAFVVIQGENPSHAYVLDTPFVKNHLQGGQQSNIIPTSIAKPNPERIVLRSKVK